MGKDSTDIFEHASVPKAVLYNIIPSIISMLMVLVYNLADTFFIGQTHNDLMIAAVSVATPAFLIFMALGMLFGIGGTSLISRLLGQGEKEKAKNVSSFCFYTGLAVGILGMIGIWIFITPLSNALGAKRGAIIYTKEYLQIIAFAIPFLLVGSTFSNIIRAEGLANKAMFGMILGNLVNIVLDPITILALGWGIRGAAVATVVGNVLSSIYYLYHLHSKNSILSISFRDFRAKEGIAFGVLAIGIPASLNSILMSVSNIVVNKQMGDYGNMAIAGLGVAMKVNMIVVMVLIGLGTGLQPLLGYCYGSKNKKRFTEVLRFSLLLAFVLSIVMTGLCFLGNRMLVSLILTKESAYGYGISFVKILMVSGPILGILFVFINSLQAMGAGLPSLVLSLSRQGIIYIPVLAYMATYVKSAASLVAAQPITDFFALAIAFVLFLYVYKKGFPEMELATEL